MSFSKAQSWNRWAGRTRATGWLILSASIVVTFIIVLVTDASEGLYMPLAGIAALGLALWIASMLDRMADGIRNPKSRRRGPVTLDHEAPSRKGVVALACLGALGLLALGIVLGLMSRPSEVPSEAAANQTGPSLSLRLEHTLQRRK